MFLPKLNPLDNGNTELVIPFHVEFADVSERENLQRLYTSSGVREVIGRNCPRLIDVTLHIGVKLVDFSGCQNLQFLALPPGVQYGIFKGCTRLKHLEVFADFRIIDMEGCPAELEFLINGQSIDLHDARMPS